MSCWSSKWTDLCRPAPHSPPAVPPSLSCGSFVSPKVRQLSVWLKWQTERSMVRGGHSPVREDINCMSLTERTSWHRFFFKFSRCRLNHQKTTFSEFPQNSHTRIVSPLPSPPLLPRSTSGWIWAVWALCNNEHTVNTHFYRLSTRWMTLSSSVEGTFLIQEGGTSRICSYFSGTIVTSSALNNFSCYSWQSEEGGAPVSPLVGND